MASWTIYYNPKCGSCRKALDLLKSKKIEPRVVEYLKTKPGEHEILALLDKLGENYPEAIRTKEEEYRAYAGNPPTTKKQMAAAIAKDPILLQRPIVIKDNRAVVARPPEKAAGLF